MYRKLRFPLLSLFLSLIAGCAVNPITGEQELMLLPEEQDLAIGRKYAPEIEKQMAGRIDDAELQNYIDSVGQKIVSISHRPDWTYHFTAVNDESVNAIALPGGYVFITRGILEELTSEAQLAGILAHEVVHIVARDTAAVMSREIGIDILLAAATSKSSSGTRTAAELGRTILGLSYSRADERSADKGGMEYMVAAKYNPHGMVETMQMLQEQQKTRTIEFFSTHPSPENRVGYLTEEIEMYYQNTAALKVGKEDFQKSLLDRLKQIPRVSKPADDAAKK